MPQLDGLDVTHRHFEAFGETHLSPTFGDAQFGDAGPHLSLKSLTLPQLRRGFTELGAGILSGIGHGSCLSCPSK